MPQPDYSLDLDRRRLETLREQARHAIEEAIRQERSGFLVGERLTTLELSRRNPIHRNTLIHAMGDLVRLGFLRRLPNRGFEIVEAAPERPALLTRHMLSLTEVAEGNQLETCSKVIPAECGHRRARDLSGTLARIREDLALAPRDVVTVLSRTRLMRKPSQRDWQLVAIEQSFTPAALLPGFLEAGLREIEETGDFSVYRTLRRAFPNDEFFRAHYEISLSPLPQALAPYWRSPNPPMNVLSVTYGSQGPVEFAQTWFDST
ncbi:MAG: UTRA domain-containing protein, partial [Anaerolineales bacterium]|nr:UTRA domain-containing protein [Anaerolineales bacterium]